ncbi:hypothetical protein EDC04DRAFT_2898216 [Pisolithus marmoratus]|nr:hypothetical protein EDC04DRAFT_2898216 [Pisolithus marmoratus]
MILPTHKKAPKYRDFTRGFEAGLHKISQYYDHTASSNAHIMMMLVDPAQKLHHIHTYWGEELLAQALQYAEAIYKE